MTSSSMPEPLNDDAGPAAGTAPRTDRSHWLYLAVIVGMMAGIVVGFVAPDPAKELKPLGTAS